MPIDYRVRLATLADADVLVRHRAAMFTDMGVQVDRATLDPAFRAWLAQTMPAGTYRAWLVETAAGEVAGGGGLTIIPWPPGPLYDGDRLAFVYNVYTDAAHRRRGLARRVMETIHDWCREAGITSVALNASRDGKPLYESMGYAESPSPMMFLPITGIIPRLRA
ncbi:MAG: GCN5-related N-acetyltransferase [Acidobacteria bacterium]|nr:GCN5-related N-acetyltransferase [Acidobacteriota bacterium]